MRLDVFQTLVRARAYGRCEGCGRSGDSQTHHRITRGMGGVQGAAYDASNNPSNGLRLCVECHDRTLDAEEVRECIAMGWVIERRSLINARVVPALIHTVNGYGWWYLTPAGTFVWADIPPEARICGHAHGAVRLSLPWAPGQEIKIENVEQLWPQQ